MDEKNKTKKQDFTNDLKKLSQISEWFEQQEELDIEDGLKKVKEAAELIKRTKQRLQEIENEFGEIKKEIIDEAEEGSNDVEGAQF
ncbi:MAG: exodeoxyribonuclease VII small subunit [Patescibacteria group bacterium]|nr:exodeoxyribonuclease VII small subunit [Patescibacteria group bacterium]